MMLTLLGTCNGGLGKHWFGLKLIRQFIDMIVKVMDRRCRHTEQKLLGVFKPGLYVRNFAKVHRSELRSCMPSQWMIYEASPSKDLLYFYHRNFTPVQSILYTSYAARLH